MSDTESAANITLEAGTSNPQVCKTGSYCDNAQLQTSKLMLTIGSHLTTFLLRKIVCK